MVKIKTSWLGDTSRCQWLKVHAVAELFEPALHTMNEPVGATAVQIAGSQIGFVGLC